MATGSFVGAMGTLALRFAMRFGIGTLIARWGFAALVSSLGAIGSIPACDRAIQGDIGSFEDLAGDLF